MKAENVMPRPLKPGGVCERALARLKSTPGLWVPMPELQAVCGSNAIAQTVANLKRRHGQLFIENRMVPRGGREKDSFYRIVEVKP